MYIKKEKFREFKEQKKVFFESPSGEPVEPEIIDQLDPRVKLEKLKKNISIVEGGNQEKIEPAEPQKYASIETNVDSFDIATLDLGKSKGETPKVSIDSINIFNSLREKTPPPTLIELKSLYEHLDEEVAKKNRLAVGMYLATKLERREADKIIPPNLIDVLNIIKNTNPQPLENNPISKAFKEYNPEEQKELVRLYISQKFELIGLGVVKQITPGKIKEDIEGPTIFTFDKDNIETKIGIKPLSNGTVKLELIQDGDTNMNARSPDLELIKCLNAIAYMQNLGSGMASP